MRWYKISQTDNEFFAVFLIVEVEPGMFAATTRDDGSIGFPGGKVDPGEDPRDAVLRESKEEGWSIGASAEELKLVHTQDVDGNPIGWYSYTGEAKALPEGSYKESGRIFPVLAKESEMYGMGNKQALSSWGEQSLDISFTRYIHSDGRGLMNNSSLDRSKLSDDEEFELIDLMDFGLEQPRDIPAGCIFAFTEEGSIKHKRLIELLSKASVSGGIKEISIDPSQYDVVWTSSDGQVALSPKE